MTDKSIRDIPLDAPFYPFFHTLDTIWIYEESDYDNFRYAARSVIELFYSLGHITEKKKDYLLEELDKISTKQDYIQSALKILNCNYTANRYEKWWSRRSAAINIKLQLIVALKKPELDAAYIKEQFKALVDTVPPQDEDLFLLRALCEKKGLNCDEKV